MYRVIYTHLFEKKIKKFKKDKGFVAELKKKNEKLLSDPSETIAVMCELYGV